MDFSKYWWQAAEAPGPGPSIGNSLRFRGSQQLTGHTGGSGTASVWIKRAKLGAAQTVMPGIAFAANDTLNGSAAVFRDPGAWMHVVVSSSSTYVNGVSVAAGSAISAGTIGASCELYLAEFCFVDGQALDPTAFGEYDTNGVWTPKEYTGTYGVNGFMLDFSDPADIGADRSGNGNDFTATGFELADQTSEDWDHMEDSPTSNGTTFNPLFNNGSNAPGTLSGANLNHAGITQYSTAPGTLSLKNGAYYFELTCGPAPATTTVPSVGIIRNTNPAANTYIGYDTAGRVYGYGNEGFGGTFLGSTDGEGTTTATQIGSGGSSWMPGDVIGVRCDVPNNYLAWYHNNALVYEVTNLNSDYDWMPAASMYASPSTPNSINFGQRPFAYDIPAGYEALQTQNLPAAPIANGRDHFQAITDTGANILTAAQTAFPNGLWWIKDRANSNQHQFVDSVRGNNRVLTCPDSLPEAAYTAPSGDSVAWCWNAGGAAVTNNDGTLETQVSANTVAGFSIVTYTGNGSSTATVGHGLGATPDMIILKARAGASADNDWYCWHQGLSAGHNIRLSRTFPEQDASILNSGVIAAPTNTTTFGFTAGSSVINVNENNTTFAAYCWTSIPGYSAIGSYTGNGSDNGPFIYTGFRVSWLMVKRTDGAGTDWIILDSTRDIFNPSVQYIAANLTDGETVYANDKVDFLSNGFKQRGPASGQNAANATYIYAAFAEVSQGGSNVSPATAR